jgi:hypothetical protein
MDKFDQLQALGAGEFSHLNGSLLSHLKGTYQLLKAWGARDALCDAGLFHAAYGTAGFDQAMVGLEQRQQIQALIGEEVEAMVYCYCACERGLTFQSIDQPQAPYKNRFTGEHSLLTGQQLKDFCELTVANEMELLNSSEAFRQQYGESLKGLFQRMTPHLSAAARAALALWLTGRCTYSMLE